MVYRETEKTRLRKAKLRADILQAAYEQVAEAGFGSASIAAISARAGIATGTVYKYFQSKEELFTEVFRSATAKEVSKVKAAVELPGSALARLENGIAVFASRAIRGRQIAWALIAEPVDPDVERERLIYRKAYADIFEKLVDEGVKNGEFAAQIPSISAAALVGVMSETLVGPLAPETSVLSSAPRTAQQRELDTQKTEYLEASSLDTDMLQREIKRFCLQAIVRK